VLCPQASYGATLRAVRNLGRDGISAMAISILDIAVWDLKARLLDVPLAVLLGAGSESVPVYGSGGFTSYDIDRLQRQLSGWVDQAFLRSKSR
jgi:L-alanine-DL-glutamate epimerase-like enolase superfamily enzyme